jgi:hypothetical protein
LRDELGADLRRRARLVLDDERLVECRAQIVGDDARDDVGRAAGRERTTIFTG